MALKTKKQHKESSGTKEFDNTNRGVLFPNEKGDNESKPDYTGKINVEGTDKRIAAWIAKSKDGMEYLRIQVSDFQE